MKQYWAQPSIKHLARKIYLKFETFIYGNVFEYIVWKWWPFHLGLYVLNEAC